MIQRPSSQRNKIAIVRTNRQLQQWDSCNLEQPNLKWAYLLNKWVHVHHNKWEWLHSNSHIKEVSNNHSTGPLVTHHSNTHSQQHNHNHIHNHNQFKKWFPFPPKRNAHRSTCV